MNDLGKTLATYYAKFGEPFPIDISDTRQPAEIEKEVRRFIRLGVAKITTETIDDVNTVY